MFVLYQRQAGHNNNQCHLDMCRGLNPPWCRRMALILSAPHTLHCNRGQRKLSCSLSSHRFWFYQRCIGCFILPQRLGFLHVSINSYTMKTLLFCSSALILSVHRSRSYTGTLWSVSFIDIDFIRRRFFLPCIALIFQRNLVQGALIVGSIVDSCNRFVFAWSYQLLQERSCPVHCIGRDFISKGRGQPETSARSKVFPWEMFRGLHQSRGNFSVFSEASCIHLLLFLLGKKLQEWYSAFYTNFVPAGLECLSSPYLYVRHI